jgi:hypothetical protein
MPGFLIKDLIGRSTTCKPAGAIYIRLSDRRRRMSLDAHGSKQRRALESRFVSLMEQEWGSLQVSKHQQCCGIVAALPEHPSALGRWHRLRHSRKIGFSNLDYPSNGEVASAGAGSSSSKSDCLFCTFFRSPSLER